jgi:DNA-binding NarL/FixJ family response regulator
MKPKPTTTARPRFTARELEVLRLITLPDKAIAAELGISIFTVRNHWRSIGTKFNAHGRVAAAVLFILGPDCPLAIRMG